MNQDNELRTLPIELEIEGQRVEAAVIQDTAGRLKVDLSESLVLNHEPDGAYERPHLQKFYEELEGRTPSGDRVRLQNIHGTFEGRGSKRGLILKSVPSVSSVTLGNSNLITPDLPVIEFSIVNLRPLIPNNTTYKPLISGDSWEASIKDVTAEPAPITSEFRATAKIKLELQPESPNLDNSIEKATSIVQDILTIAKFFQGHGNDYIACELVGADDTAEQSTYLELREENANLGAQFDMDIHLSDNLKKSFERAYVALTDAPDVVKTLIEYYVDSLNQLRSRNNQTSTACLGLATYLSHQGENPEIVDSSEMLESFRAHGIETNDLDPLALARLSGASTHLPEDSSYVESAQRSYGADSEYTTLLVLLIRSIDQLLTENRSHGSFFDVRPEEIRPYI